MFDGPTPGSASDKSDIIDNERDRLQRQIEVEKLQFQLNELQFEQEAGRRKSKSKTQSDINIDTVRQDKRTQQIVDKKLRKLDQVIPIFSDTDETDTESESTSHSEIDSIDSQDATASSRRQKFRRRHRKTKGKKSRKSGYFVKAQRRIKVKVKWPHGFCGDLLGTVEKADLTPDNLSESVFILGYMNILASNISTSEHDARVKHLKTLMTLSITHSWEIARAYHYKLLRCMEFGLIAWGDDIQSFMVGHLANIMSQSTSTKTIKPAKYTDKLPTDARPQRTVYCISFNSDTKCQYETSDRKCSKLHACKKCGEEKGWLTFDHSAKNCPRTGTSKPSSQ